MVVTAAKEKLDYPASEGRPTLTNPPRDCFLASLMSTSCPLWLFKRQPDYPVPDSSRIWVRGSTIGTADAEVTPPPDGSCWQVIGSYPYRGRFAKNAVTRTGRSEFKIGLHALIPPDLDVT